MSKFWTSFIFIKIIPNEESCKSQTNHRGVKINTFGPSALPMPSIVSNCMTLTDMTNHNQSFWQLSVTFVQKPTNIPKDISQQPSVFISCFLYRSIKHFTANITWQYLPRLILMSVCILSYQRFARRTFGSAAEEKSISHLSRGFS